MKIALVGFEHGISCIGVRRLSSLLKSRNMETETYIYNLLGTNIQHTSILDKGSRKKKHAFNKVLLDRLKNVDVVGISGMTISAGVMRRFSSEIRDLNPDCHIVCGGVHAMVFPEDAIQYADAVCLGEGEKAFLDFLDKLERGLNPRVTKGFWFKSGNDIIRNGPASLMNGREFSEMPFQDYGFDLWHVTDKKIEKFTQEIYFREHGAKYQTMWSLGCPFECSYCCNSAFSKHEPGNRMARYAPPEYIIKEILQALKIHDYISYIVFQDDQFLLITEEDLKRFAALYKEKIGIPFSIPGLHPKTLNKDKMDLLLDAGMRKVRMGVQSGSNRMLAFYNRKHSRDDAIEAANYLASLYPKINPPFFDIILDNPIETESDQMDTVRMLYELQRPFCLYVYSLKIIPGTEMAIFAQQHPEMKWQHMEDGAFLRIKNLKIGFLVYLLSVWRPPRWLFDCLIRLSSQPLIAKIGLFVAETMCLIKRAFFELRLRNLQPVAVFSPGMAMFLQKWVRPRLKKIGPEKEKNCPDRDAALGTRPA